MQALHVLPARQGRATSWLVAALCPPAWGLGQVAGGPAVVVGGREAEPLGFGEPLTELMASLWLPLPVPREGHLDPPEVWLGSPHPNVI